MKRSHANIDETAMAERPIKKMAKQVLDIGTDESSSEEGTEPVGQASFFPDLPDDYHYNIPSITSVFTGTPGENNAGAENEDNEYIRQNKYPNTKEYYEQKNAVEKPVDGLNTLPENGKCLTCIKQGGGCRGTSVEDGRCSSCRGIGVAASRKRRACLWKDPSKGIYTYDQAQEVLGTRKIKKNTREGKDKAKRKAEKAKARARAEGLTLFNLSPGSYEGLLLAWLVAGLYDTGFASDNDRANADAMLAHTEQRLRWVESGRVPFPNARVRGEVVNAINEIFARLAFLRVYHGLSGQDITDLLPDNHLAKTR